MLDPKQSWGLAKKIQQQWWQGKINIYLPIFVSISFARFDFWLYFCQVRLPPEPGSDGVSPPVCSPVLCLHAGIIRYHCWIALFLMDLISGAVHAGGSQEPRDVEGSHGDRERHPAEDWQVCHHYHHHDIILRTIITNHHKCKCHHHSSLFSPASPLPHSGSLASAAASLW